MGDTCGNPSSAILCFWMAPSLSIPWLGLHRSLLDVWALCTHTSAREIPIRTGEGINSSSRDSAKVSLSSIAQKLSHYGWAISEATTWEQTMSSDPLQNVSFCTNHPWQFLSRVSECLTLLMKQVMSKGSTALGCLQWFYYPHDRYYSLLCHYQPLFFPFPFSPELHDQGTHQPD